ncbi:MAG TPA: histidine kinase [Jiangellales bacterium]|nr:histidine kinase [Jiangellales bacterium]
MDRRRAVLALLVAVAAGLGSLALTLTSSHAEPRGPVQSGGPVMGLVIGWSFAGAGVVASVLRPSNRFGLLLYATGLAWFLSALMAAERPTLFTLGLLTAPWWLGVFVHALLAFPGGRLEGRWRRLLVAVLYVDVTVVQVLRLLFTRSGDLPGCGDCPDNVLLLSDQPDVAATILVVQQAVIGSLVIGGTLVLLTRQWLDASVPQRRVLSPVLLTGAMCLVVQAVALAAEPFSVRQSVDWLGALAFAAVPVAFLLGLLRQRLDRSAVGQLVVDLGASRDGFGLDDLLRKALRDPSLQVAFWRGETGEFVDAAGRPVALPVPDGQQAVTLVERDGRRIAALVHDESLADDPALVSGAVAAAGLALENERLHAAVRAQLEDLRASRRRLVEAGDRERRRLERNLHDGAQQRLLAVSMLLSQLERAPGGDATTRELAAQAQAELGRSLSELRDLAVGLHPAALTDYGLAVALHGLAARAPVRVELVVEMPRRPPLQVEVAAYYVISEALANVVKHAAATRASVRVCDDGSILQVDVVDDGVGGVHAQGGSGLQGLRDRLAALDGRLVVTSPPGKGTTVRAMIPCA